MRAFRHEHPELYVVNAGDPGWIDAAAAAPMAAAAGPDAGAGAGAGAGAAADSSDDTFTPASAFGGAKPGWVFKEGDRGTGYYRDNTDTAQATVPLSSVGVADPASAAAVPLGGKSAPPAVE